MPAPEIQSSDITDRLVGITPVYLNQFMQRGYGMKASVEPGGRHEKRRKFSKDDVFGIALVWLLFESGLRSDPIRRVLKEVGKTKGKHDADANRAAEILRRSGVECLVIIREPRRPKQATEAPAQRVVTATSAEVTSIVESNADCTVSAIPIGSKFADLERRLEILY